MDETEIYTPTAEEAMFMLVSCSAFINYLNRKCITEMYNIAECPTIIEEKADSQGNLPNDRMNEWMGKTELGWHTVVTWNCDCYYHVAFYDVSKNDLDVFK